MKIPITVVVVVVISVIITASEKWKQIQSNPKRKSKVKTSPMYALTNQNAFLA